METFVETNYGYCYYQKEDSLIYSPYVFPKFRGQGKSERLLLLAILELLAEGCTKPFYIKEQPKENCMTKEELTNFYESFGLVVIN